MERIIRKEGFRQTLVIQGIEESYGELELAMLQNNQPAHLFPVQIQTMNGEIRYLYDIGGYWRLKDFYENKEMPLEQVKRLIENLLDTMEDMQKYLLQGHRLLVTEEDIYISEGGSGFRFCYVPGYDNEFGEQICRLVEFFMNHMNHKEEESVVFVYGLYKMVKEERVSIPLLKDFLKQHNKKAEVEEIIPAPKEETEPNPWETIEKMEEKSIEFWGMVKKIAIYGGACLVAMLVGYMIINGFIAR